MYIIKSINYINSHVGYILVDIWIFIAFFIYLSLDKATGVNWIPMLTLHLCVIWLSFKKKIWRRGAQWILGLARLRSIHPSILRFTGKEGRICRRYFEGAFEGPLNWDSLRRAAVTQSAIPSTVNKSRCVLWRPRRPRTSKDTAFRGRSPWIGTQLQFLQIARLTNWVFKSSLIEM